MVAKRPLLRCQGSLHGRATTGLEVADAVARALQIFGNKTFASDPPNKTVPCRMPKTWPPRPPPTYASVDADLHRLICWHMQDASSTPGYSSSGTYMSPITHLKAGLDVTFDATTQTSTICAKKRIADGSLRCYNTVAEPHVPHWRTDDERPKKMMRVPDAVRDTLFQAQLFGNGQMESIMTFLHEELQSPACAPSTRSSLSACLKAGDVVFYQHPQLGKIVVSIEKVDHEGNADGGATYLISSSRLEGVVKTVRERLDASVARIVE